MSKEKITNYCYVNIVCQSVMSSMLPHQVSVLSAVLSAVMGATPLVTWHGLGGTTSECDRMIDTIRSVSWIVEIGSLTEKYLEEGQKEVNTLYTYYIQLVANLMYF